MKKTYVAFIWLASLVFLAVKAPGVHAATPGGGHPSIAIANLRDGSVVRGSSLTVHVSVSNFKLVPPVYISPPLLRGNQGHIHYVLDGLANFKPTRDASAMLSHTWTGVSPGRHTVVAYLATSQHARFAGARQARVAITVMSQTARAGGSAVASAPRSGGAVDDAQPASLALLLPAILALVTGAVFLGMARRRTATGIGGS